MQVVLVYLEWFRRNSLLKCVMHPKIAKNSLKIPIFCVQGRSRSWMLVPLESSSAVLVMICSKSVSICNHSRARLVNSSRNRTFSRGCPNLKSSYGGLHEPRGSNHTQLKSTFNAKHFICRLSWSIYGSRSFKVIDVGTIGKLVRSACYDKQQVCVYMQPFSCWMSQ